MRLPNDPIRFIELYAGNKSVSLTLAVEIIWGFGAADNALVSAVTKVFDRLQKSLPDTIFLQQLLNIAPHQL